MSTQQSEVELVESEAGVAKISWSLLLNGSWLKVKPWQLLVYIVLVVQLFTLCLYCKMLIFTICG